MKWLPQFQMQMEMSQEARDRCIRSLNYYNTTILDIEDKSTEKGMEQGIEKVAKNMLKSGKPIEEIMEMTRLSKEQINNLIL